MKGKALDAEDDLHTAFALSSSEAFDDDPVLESKHKIFLSHSGAQKEFVDHLCKALEERCHYPFFDRRPESLPKGKKFPELIFKAVQQCQLFVVVVSEEYFMSKWPMIELDAFVKAMNKMKSSMNQGILPLFYGLSVSELKDEKRRQRWFEAWETFAREDVRGLIKVDDWKYALDEFTKFNGLPYDRKSKQVVEYENAIVSHICNLVKPDIKWEDSHVQGNAHEVVIEKMKQVKASQLTQAKVVGLYGVGGIGKTTICNTLCNELSNDYEGRVCHIEFDSKSSNSKELLQKVLIKLTRKSCEAIQQLDEGECKDILYKNLMKQKTFLAIDNVWDNAKSIKQALVYLKAPFHPNSLVLVTTRAQRTLELLEVDGYLEMPKLGQRDATNLFLHYAANGQEFTNEGDMRSIDLCVKRCYFSKGGGGGFHYHPLALEVLGRQLGCHGRNPFEWEEALSSIWNFNAFSGENEVFDVLRTSFDLLQPIEQALFMDVGIFFLHLDEDALFDNNRIVLLDRLCAIHKQGGQDLQSLLNSLKGKGLLQDVDLSLGRITMHDLYREFAFLEAKGKLGEASSIGNRSWMYVDVQDGDLAELEVTPIGGCWQNLKRLSIREGDHLTQLSRWEPIPYSFKILVGIEWQHFSNVLVLQLVGLNTMKGTLNLKGMKCLRSLQILDLFYIETLEGLEELMNLTLFEWTSNPLRGCSELEAIMGQFPRSLKYLDIRYGRVLSGVDVFFWCTNLCKLVLESIEVGELLDLKNCSSLKHVELCHLMDLKTLLLPPTRVASNLQSLNVGTCFHLVDIQGLNQLVCLEHLNLNLLYLKEVPNLLSLTNLQTLTMRGGKDFIELHIPQQLRELCHKLLKGSIQAPNLSGFNQLQVLDLSFSHNLTSISVMGDLPALRTFNLFYCQRLRRLPNLSKWRSLEELDLDGCDALELHEEDIQMLATLSLLHPVHFSSATWSGTKLDPCGRKVLRYVEIDDFPPKSSLNWMEGEWEEEELGPPPIKLRDITRPNQTLHQAF